MTPRLAPEVLAEALRRAALRDHATVATRRYGALFPAERYELRRFAAAVVAELAEMEREAVPTLLA